VTHNNRYFSCALHAHFQIFRFIATVKKHLQKYFGFDRFRPGQEEAIQSILEGQDTLVVMPTGSGKSLCYQLPALMLSGLTLVVSPLIALMKDQVDFLRSMGLAATFINSSIPAETQNERLRQVLDGKVKILYVAPERFRIAGFQQILEKLSVSLFAVDEAHCISLWGHDFRPDYLLLKDVVEELGRPTVAALTATATRRVQKDIVAKLDLKKPKSVITGFNRPNLTFRVFPTFGDYDKFSQINRMITERIGSAIIYVGTRKQAEMVSAYLNEVRNIRALHYHAGLPEHVRSETQNKFMSNQIQVIVATNAFGMGVDKPDIRLVLHWAIPGTLEAYYQEAGRAGRDGKRSGCVLLYDPQDKSLQEWFIDNDAPDYSELLNIYYTIKSLANDNHVFVRMMDLQEILGTHDVNIRVGLKYLENSDAIKNLGETAGRLSLQLLPLDMEKVARTAEMIEERREHKYSMLYQMITYAESRQCRRQILLDHFGDKSKPEAIICCDNCERAANGTEEAKPLSPVRAQEIDLGEAILQVVANHWCHVGVTKVAQILAGSRAHSITRYGHHRNELYGAFADMKITEIELEIKKLIELDFLQRVYEGEYIVLNLTPAGSEALSGKRLLPTIKKREKKPPTVEITLGMFRNGLKPDEIAEKRKLTVNTIYVHLAKAVEAGEISATDLIDAKRLKQIRSAIEKAGVMRLAPIKDILPSSFSYDEIRVAVADYFRKKMR